MAGVSFGVGRYLLQVIFLFQVLRLVSTDCDVLVAPQENGYFEGNPTTVGSMQLLHIKCNVNYTLVGIKAFYCVSTSFMPELATSLPVCHENCVDPGEPALGSHSSTPPTQPYDMYPFNAVIVFECDPNTLVEGPLTITCFEGGQWTGTVPICHKNCEDPGSPDNGHQEAGGTYIHGGQVLFSCDDGRSPVGRNPITCQDGVWLDPLPHCSVVIIITLEITVTSGGDFVTGRVNNGTVNFQATSSSLSIDIFGTGLWKITTYLADGADTVYASATPELTSDQEDQPLAPGDVINFNGIDYSIDGDEIWCSSDGLQLCAKLEIGDDPNPEFDLVRLGGGNLTACQAVTCDVNECLNSSSCPFRNQVCENLPGTFNCTCAAGWEGEDCQTMVDNCASNPCQHAGRCTNRVNYYVCQCWAGYQGVHCEEQIDFCEDAACEHNSTCETLLSGYQCHCRPGYQGEHCENTVPFFTKCPTGEAVEFVLPLGQHSISIVNLSDVVSAEDWQQRSLQVQSTDPAVSLPGTIVFSADFQAGKTVELQSTDSNGNSASCSFVIKLIDEEPPEITCPENVIVQTYEANDALIWPPVVATDNAMLHPTDAMSYSMSNGSTVTSDGEPHTVTATTKDSSENTASCSFNVTLVQIKRPPSGSDASRTAAIAGSVVGAIAFVCLLAFVGLLLIYRRKEATKASKYWKSMSGQPGQIPATKSDSDNRQPQTFQNAAYENAD